MHTIFYVRTCFLFFQTFPEILYTRAFYTSSNFVFSFLFIFTVISSAKEPIPGWINNVYGPTGVVAAAAVGLMRSLNTDQNCKANIVPCDYVVNAAIAAAWGVSLK